MHGLSKVHICEPEGKLSAILETTRCPICDRVSVNSVRGCDSGDTHKINQRVLIHGTESGDSIPPGLEQNCSNVKVLNYETKSLRSKTLAGGDHQHCSKCFRAISKSKSLNDIDANEKLIPSRFSLPEEVKVTKAIHEKSMEATIKYKNVNFRESDSLLSVPGTNEEALIKNDKLSDITHRFGIRSPGTNVTVEQIPITCPVSNCRKMIAKTSVLQHFIFDHSKIPRITLNITDQHRVFINIAAITREIRCYAVFLVKIEAPLVHTDSDTLVNGEYKNASFLLMGVRMQGAETIKKLHGCVSIRHAQTQTEARISSKVNSDSKYNNETIVADYGAERYFVKNHNTILLWICNLGNIVFFYNISIKRSDKKLGYSFTGETVNIGQSHNLPEMHEVECLRILEKGSIRLINEQNELEVTVNVFK